jgi:hypothetical protein
MKLGAASRLPSKKGLPILLSVSLFLLTASAPLFLGNARSRRSVMFNHEVQAASTVVWPAGNFRHLEDMSGDLVTFVQGLEHPKIGGYGKLSQTRQANFNLFLDALFTAIEASLADGATGDWCGVKTKASAAGYAIYRFYDTDSGRWFVYAYDTRPTSSLTLLPSATSSLKCRMKGSSSARRPKGPASSKRWRPVRS